MLKRSEKLEAVKPQDFVWEVSNITNMQGIASNGSKYIAITGDNQVHISYDGLNWTSKEVGSASHRFIIYAMNKFLIFSSNEGYSSIDGEVWEPIGNLGISGTISKVIGNDNLILIKISYGTDTVYFRYSTNSLDWYSLPSASWDTNADCCVSGDRFAIWIDTSLVIGAIADIGKESAWDHSTVTHKLSNRIYPLDHLTPPYNNYFLLRGDDYYDIVTNEVKSSYNYITSIQAKASKFVCYDENLSSVIPCTIIEGPYPLWALTSGTYTELISPLTTTYGNLYRCGNRIFASQSNRTRTTKCYDIKYYYNHYSLINGIEGKEGSTEWITQLTPGQTEFTCDITGDYSFELVGGGAGCGTYDAQYYGGWSNWHAGSGGSGAYATGKVHLESGHTYILCAGSKGSNNNGKKGSSGSGSPSYIAEKIDSEVIKIVTANGGQGINRKGTKSYTGGLGGTVEVNPDYTVTLTLNQSGNNGKVGTGTRRTLSVYNDSYTGYGASAKAYADGDDSHKLYSQSVAGMGRVEISSTDNYYDNVILVGGTVVDNHILSNFSTANYARLPRPFSPEGNKWEINVGITTGADVTTSQYILNCNQVQYSPVEIVIISGKFHWELSSNGTSNMATTADGTYTVQPNTSYRIKVTFDGTKYELKYSLDGEQFITDITHTSSTPILSGKNQIFGVDYTGSKYTAPFLGTIDLTKCNVIIGQTVWWDCVKSNVNTTYNTHTIWYDDNAY